MLRRLASLSLALVLVVATLLISPRDVLASPVADNDVLYALCGRVFPDPHAGQAGLPARSPHAQGNLPCAATQFIQFTELKSGLAYLEGRFPRFLDVVTIPGESAGLPTSTLQRERFPLLYARVTDESVTAPKKRLAFALSIHGIERAAVEGGTRALEDLVTFGTNDPGRRVLVTNVPSVANPTVGEALRALEIYFFYPNPDGWNRGDISRGGAFYQRYNGNGVDLNRDWPNEGYIYRPYTPFSEPESRTFGEALKAIAPTWDGGADLHGQLDAPAFTFTMLGSGQQDYGKNRRVLNIVTSIWRDAEQRLAWSPLIKPNTATRDDPRMYGQQWGTVWDTINYTVNGSLGDWINNPTGLGGDGIDNEMSLSHLTNNNRFDPDIEQLHIDGNKGLIYTQMAAALTNVEQTFRQPGRSAFLQNPKVVTHPGSPASTNPFAGLPAQAPIERAMCSPGTEVCQETVVFKVNGTEDAFFNGGFKVTLTYTNAQGISPDAIASVFVERRDDTTGEWELVAEDYNQSPIYLQAGMTVDVNSPRPGVWRVRLVNAPGAHQLRIDFTTAAAWPDPGQLAFSATSMRFFEDLNRFAGPGAALASVSVAAILDGSANLDRYDTLVVVNDPLPGFVEAAVPTGPAQAGYQWTAVAPVPALGARIPGAFHTFEFDVLDGFNNQSMTVALSWTSDLNDHDLFVEKQDPATGRFTQVDRSAAGFTNFERVIIRNPAPGRYRAVTENFASAEPTANGTVTFSNVFEGVLPGASTLTAEQKDTYYRALDAFVSRGGNLVLTDGALRGLKNLGIGTAGDVRLSAVFAGFIGFTRDGGATNSYADPLAANVNQPGAAEGPQNRHQTYEPVPLGYAIGDAPGPDQQSTAPAWTVRQAAWEAAGGRTVGTTGAGLASLGEVARGLGRIRIAGALLPDPSDRYDHPFGVASYALTYTGYQLFENLVQWRRPLPDLALSANDIAFSRVRVVEGDRVLITATIRNVGTAPAGNVAVRFTDNGAQIGTDQVIADIAPGASATASVLWDVRRIRGERTITVTADPLDTVRELDETNNSATRVVLVKGNRVRNGSFESANASGGPENWTASGNTTYAQGGSDGARSAATNDASGSWTSDPIAVTGGATYGVRVDVSGAGGAVAIEQLSVTGLVLGTLTQLVGATAAGAFEEVNATITAAADATQVRVKLSGALTGVATFDNVRLWEE